MKKTIFTIATAAALMLTTIASAQSWAPAGDRIKTVWADQVSPTNAHKEYPRPQLVRGDWQSLNGLWEYKITKKGASKPSGSDGKILVPFCVESSLSGVGKTLTADDALWYKTKFKLPSGWKKKTVRLNFEGVDWKAEVYFNGKKVGEHTGGYTYFSFDVTPYLKGGKQELVVKVTDGTNNDFQPRGKQTLTPSGIWYTAVSGIWQSVWMEAVSDAYITDYATDVDYDNSSIRVNVATVGTAAGDKVQVEVIDGGVGFSTEAPQGSVIKTVETTPGKVAEVVIPQPKSWSPDSPYLYGLRMKLVRNGKVIDETVGYTALRKISVKEDKNGRKRLALNNEILFQFGPLDQGWWPDGLYTAPTDEALRFDIVKTKDFGFNMIRKHVKVEPARWYYHCDQLGMLVWQDMPSFADNQKAGWGTQSYNQVKDWPVTDEIKANFYKEWGEIVDQHKKFPCIVVWVPFNEGWGQFETAKVVEFTKEKDPSRLVNMASGGSWFTTSGKDDNFGEPRIGDIIDVHHYPDPWINFWDYEMVNVLGEFGGIGMPVEGHLWNSTGRNWGYVQDKDGSDVLKRYYQFAKQLKKINNFGCSAAVYTQTTDVEGEVNGLMTYDRKIIKMDEASLNSINQDVISSAAFE